MFLLDTTLVAVASGRHRINFTKHTYGILNKELYHADVCPNICIDHRGFLRPLQRAVISMQCLSENYIRKRTFKQMSADDPDLVSRQTIGASDPF
ncbi:hypothetical protein V1264_016732 [Littorina saxatilis]|uniref:Uncharacterized protein n=1 Tax=Littorina saxatilis TaxID=31220 RepID=A0AAN9GF01_9CAEN